MSFSSDLEPRHYQIGILLLLVLGFLCLGKSVIQAESVLWILSSVFFLQFLCDRFLSPHLVSRRAFFDEWESLIIGSLSLCLMMQFQTWALCLSSVVLLVGARVLFRWRNKLWVNPLALSLSLVLLYAQPSGRVLLNPTLWPSSLEFLFCLLVVGTYGLWKLRRTDGVLSFFLNVWVLFEGRSWILGESLPVDLSAMTLGGLLFVVFFVLADPQSTPTSREGRCLWGAFVALLTYALHFTPLSPYALIFAITLSGPLTPFLDSCIPGQSFRWPKYQLRALSLRDHAEGAS
jgi:Na+-transporting NADH:ubiquinone oxidoreductase subunit NqrB